MLESNQLMTVLQTAAFPSRPCPNIPLPSLMAWYLAALRGIEPVRFLESESSVLPLNERAVAGRIGFAPMTRGSSGRRSTTELPPGTVGLSPTTSFGKSLSWISFKQNGCGGWDRTNDLSLNRRSHYHCATPHRRLPFNAARPAPISWAI